jgi:uncharacterized membrane protein YkvI
LQIDKVKPEYITILLMAIVSIVLILTSFTGLNSAKEVILYLLVIVLLYFLTDDIQRKSSTGKTAYKYVVLIILFSYLSMF